MGQNKRRRKHPHRRQKFISLLALHGGHGDISSLITKAKLEGKRNVRSRQRAQEAQEVAKKSLAEAEVTELFMLIPGSVTAPQLVTALLSKLYALNMLSRDDLTRHLASVKISNSPVVRCEINQNTSIIPLGTAFVAMRTANLATLLIQSSPLQIENQGNITIMRSMRVSLPQNGSAWRASIDPGSQRWKVGTVQVGEKVSKNLFSSFWTSSPLFDLKENSYVELNPVRSALAITIGRRQTMLKASPSLRNLEKTSSMLRLEFPFRTVCGCPTVERQNKASEVYAVSFPVSKPPLLFREGISSSQHLSQDRFIWDCVQEVGKDHRWIRTVDPTSNNAFCRTTGVRVLLGKSEMYAFYKALHRFCIADQPRPILEIGKAQSEVEGPNRHAMFQRAAMLFNISFPVRYMVDCVLSLRNVREATITDQFWITVSLKLKEEDALHALDHMYFRLSNNEYFGSINDPMAMLADSIEQCNISERSYGEDQSDVFKHGESSVNSDEDADSIGTEDTEDFLMERFVRQLKSEHLTTSDDGASSSNQKNTGLEAKPSLARPSLQHAYIRRLIYSPTATIALREESDLLNRVLREYVKHKDRFIRISFADENGDSVSFAGSDDLYARIRIALDQGICCGGEKFMFLAFSNSQLRDHAAWFYNETPDRSAHPPTADDIRAWMGDFHKIRIPGKFAARQGQTFSSTVGTVLIDDVQEQEICDVEDNCGQYVFSDGVGLMSSELGRKVAQRLRIPGKCRVPSAFQVRFGGAKGMLTVWDEMLPDDNRVEVALRPSMKKFDSTHKALEIVGYAKRLPMFLNRQIIMLLSGLGVPDAPFIEMQQKLLDSLDRAMLKDGGSVAVDLLYRSGYGASDTKLRASAPMTNVAYFFQAGLDCESCQHLHNMMHAFRLRTLRGLMLRSRIPISSDKGVCALGVMDESGVLKANQVFCQYTEPASGATNIVSGVVTVGRSPCLHPGDIMPLLAVDHPSLRHLVDVIVFPRVGSRPIPSMLSGGDLDGDVYFCIFDDTLAVKRCFKPMDYAAPKPKHLDRSVTTHDVADFFVEYMRNDKLGVIANAHVVHSDKEKCGISSKKCLDLAMLHSVAVDFAKTGVPANVPRELLPRNKPGEYPDFMGKHPKVSYPSEKILGKLFRACNEIQSGKKREFSSFPNARSRRVDDIIGSFTDNQELRKEAMALCESYNFDLRRIMTLYGVHSEGEVITGQVLSFMERHTQLRGTREYFALVMRLNRETSGLRKEYRAMFFRGLGQPDGGVYNTETIIKASMWHKVCHEQAIEDRKNGINELISFPWVVSDVLLCIISAELQKEK